MKGWERSLYCGQVQAAQAGKTVTLNGWVDRRRDLGGLIFVHLRDREGIVQVVFNPEKFPDAHRCAEEMRSEYVVAVRGEVCPRPAESVNDDLPTGAIEVLAHAAIILNDAKTPRVCHRGRDRRGRGHPAGLPLPGPATRAAAAKPASAPSVLPGDAAVPGRPRLRGSGDARAHQKHAGGRAGLPGAQPGESGRILRAPAVAAALQATAHGGGLRPVLSDRQVLPGRGPARRPAAGVHADRHRDVLRGSATQSWRRWRAWSSNSSARYGGSSCRDRSRGSPSTRRSGGSGWTPRTCASAWSSKTSATLFAGCEFRAFAQPLAAGGRAMALRVPGQGEITRSQLDQLEAFAKGFGAKGLAWFKIGADGITSPVAKFLPGGLLQRFRERMGGEPGDLLLLCVDRPKAAADAMGRLRLKFGHELKLIDPQALAIAWVTDFPLFEWDEKEKRWSAMHHPFTSPMDEDLALFDTRPREDAGQGLRPGDQRRRGRRRQHPDPPPRGAEQDVPDSGHRPRGGPSQVRFPPGCPGVRHAARTAASRSVWTAW